MIDAAIAAISEATGVHGTVGNFQVSSVTGGSDALGAVAITVDSDGRKVTGRGVATDVVEASARAYLNAVNKLVRLRERGDVRENDREGRVSCCRQRQPVAQRGARARRTCEKREIDPASRRGLRGAARGRCPRAGRACARSRHRRRQHARARARRASRARPASGSTSRTRCSTAPASGSPASTRSRSAATTSTSRCRPTSASSTWSSRASRSTTCARPPARALRRGLRPPAPGRGVRQRRARRLDHRPAARGVPLRHRQQPRRGRPVEQAGRRRDPFGLVGRLRLRRRGMPLEMAGTCRCYRDQARCDGEQGVTDEHASSSSTTWSRAKRPTTSASTSSTSSPTAAPGPRPAPDARRRRRQ